MSAVASGVFVSRLVSLVGASASKAAPVDASSPPLDAQPPSRAVTSGMERSHRHHVVWYPTVRRAALFWLVSVGVVGCDAALGIEPIPKGNAPLIAHASPLCARCAADTCKVAATTCEKSRTCLPLYACIARCAVDDPKCRATCEKLSPLAATEASFRDLDRCFRTSCTEECYGITGLGGLFADKDRCKCLDAACGPQELACIRSGVGAADSDAGTTPEVAGECERRAACLASVSIDPESADSCAAAHPEGAAAASALKECWSNTSCAECPVAGTGLYQCVGNYRWTAPTTKEVRITFRVTTFDAEQRPIAGAKVVACGADKCDRCDEANSLKATTSDAEGKASLQLTAGLAGFAGCFDFQAPGFAHMALTLGRPLGRDSSTPMFMVAAETLPLLGAVAGTTLMPDRGQLVVFGVDCFVSFAAGVSMSIDSTDPAIRKGYFVNNLFDVKATETGRLGVGVFLNVPSGAVTLDLRQGAKLVSRLPVVTRPSVVTTVLAMPSTMD